MCEADISTPDQVVIFKGDFASIVVSSTFGCSMEHPNTYVPGKLGLQTL